MMDDKFDEAEFWLPSEFLTDEDILMDHTKDSFGLLLNSKPTPPSSALRFPPAFPSDYGCSSLSSPVDSSAETESSDEDDFLLAGFNRQLTLGDAPKLIPTQQNNEKAKVMSGSPQSTLTKVGSWSGWSTISSNGSPSGPSQVSSPPTTPLGVENDPWDLIYQAAGQIARLKMSGGEGLSRNPGILGPPKRLPTPPPLKNSAVAPSLYDTHVKQDACSMWSRDVKNGWRHDSQEIFQSIGGRVGRVGMVNGMGPTPCVWSSQQRNQQQLGGDYGVKGGVYGGSGGYGYGFGYGSGGGVGGGSGGLKRERAGTGVFLPRRYDNNNYNSCKASEYRKKPGFSSGMQPQSKVAPNSNNGLLIDCLNGNVQPRPRYINSNGELVGDYASVARRNAAALLVQQRRTNICSEGGASSMSHEICLPQEWTY